MSRIVRLAMVTPCTLPPVQMPNGTLLVALFMPVPTSTTSSRLLVAPRSPTLVKVPLIHSVLVSRYVPGASTIVVFDASCATAVCSCASVDTLTTAPEGAASGGAGFTDRANAAGADPAVNSSAVATISSADRGGTLQ